MLKERRERVAALVDWRDEITLVPYSGVQVLDFGFALDAVELKASRFIERTTGERDGRAERMLLPLTGEEERDAPIEAGALPEAAPCVTRVRCGGSQPCRSCIPCGGYRFQRLPLMLNVSLGCFHRR